MDKELQSDKILCSTSFVNEDDSILDFKSPKSKIIKSKLSEFTKSNTMKQKRKTTTKFKNFVKNHKEIKLKQHLENRENLEKSQPSIELSFFKSKEDCDNKDPITDAKVALVCPLCFKMFKDLDSQVLHMKSCACKNNISTKKLLNAIQLQKRQENERKSLGLLAAPILQNKKKPVSCKINLHEDSDLQLALALSKSLQEAEELDDINEIEKLSEVPNQSVSETLKPIYKRPLETFGFANSKPASLIKNKKKKHNEITVLQTRSQEERNRILTERIAEILMGDEPVTQKQKEEIQCNQEIKMETVLKSSLLRELYYKDEKLWDKARLTPSRKSFYVTNLSEYIVPQEEQIAAKEENVIKSTNTCKIDGIKLNQDQTNAFSDENKFYEMPQTDLCFTNEECENCDDKQFINTLVTNWGNALNDSSASDIIIFVNNNKYIWAHKLVFYIRCSNLLLDVIPNDISLFTTIKEKICWFDISYNIAIAFLEFIYCGIIRKYLNIFEDLESFSSLRNLARKYKVKELFTYLQKKEAETKRTKVQIHDTKDTEYEKTLIVREKVNSKLNASNSENVIRDRKEVVLDESEKSSEKYLEGYIANKSAYSEINLKNATSLISNTQSSVARNLYKQELEENTCIERLFKKKVDDLSEINIVRHSNVSPDMFDDINDIMPRHKEKHTDLIGDIENTKKDFSILDSVNEIVVDTVDSSKIMNTTLSKNVEECINSLLNTPHSSRSKKRNINQSTRIKTKSNLSLFIEQFQKENAKSDFDADSEVTMISVSPKLYRNPFNVKQYDDSDQYSISYENTVKEKTLEKGKDVLSIFDYIVTNSKLNEESTLEESDTNMHLEPVDNLTQLLEYNVRNSTEKYMKNNPMNKNVNNVDKQLQNEITPNNKLDNTTKGRSVTEYSDNQDSTLSDFDTDEDEISMYTRYKRGHQNNSIVKYRDFIKKDLLNDSAKNSSDDYEYERKSNTNNEDVTLLTDIDVGFDLSITPEKKHINQTEKKQLTFNLEKSMQTSEQSSQNLDSESDKGNKDKNYFSDNITSPISSQRRTDNSSKLKYSKSKRSIDLHTFRNNSLISLTQPKIKKFNSMDSPVLISSSPELDFDALIVDTCDKSNVNNNVSNLKESDGNTYIFEKDVYLANVHINDDSDNDKDSRNTSLPITEEVNQLTEFNSSHAYNKKQKETSSTVTSDKNNGSTVTNNFFLEELRNTERLLTIKQSNRSFQRKSMSETNLNINTKGIKNKVSGFYNSLNQSQCKCGRKKILRTLASSIIIKDNITPPNYNDLKTPELHAELHKYGLKVQKRNRAVKLLTYIYNELHPAIHTIPKKVESEFAVISSDNEEPPTKKKYYNKSDVDCIDDYKYELPLSPNSTVTMQFPLNIISEEKQFDESESITATDSTPHIKDVFFKLIKVNKELHNNILAYEPLCIESLHFMLKEEGFKCKINTLMDFLDEQCITFYFQETKQKKNKKK